MDLIYYHPITGGKLYQSGVEEIPGCPRNFLKNELRTGAAMSKGLGQKGIDLLVLSAEEYQPNIPFNRVTQVIYAPMDDIPDPTPEELNHIVHNSVQTSEKVAKAILEGKTCLVTCYMGLNRSGLISALTLLRLTQITGKQAIQHIRRYRKSTEHLPLNNPAFQEIIEYLSLH